MYVKRIKYVDYDGVEREEDFHFNLSKAEVAELEVANEGGTVKMLQRIIQAQDQKKIVEVFKEFIMLSYGVKSPDGKRFIKSPEQSIAFTQTEAYSELFFLLSTDGEEAAAFIKGIIPQVPVESN